MVSIIIPTFNEEKNIERLLLSIKEQSYKKIEVIVVDDGSCDNTKLKVKNAKLGRELRFFEREHAERSVQRNFGAKKAKGKYLIFLDADMELHKGLIASIVKKMKSGRYGALIIPERTAGESFLARVRRFERDMYRGDATVEVARAFPKKIFKEFGGYDENLTGAEDYDLPYRISKSHKVGWSGSYLIHHEERLTLRDLLRKKYYYASRSTSYAGKHPELILTQGTILFRKAYLRNWRKFLGSPLLGISFIVIRAMTAGAAFAGFIKGTVSKV